MFRGAGAGRRESTAINRLKSNRSSSVFGLAVAFAGASVTLLAPAAMAQSVPGTLPSREQIEPLRAPILRPGEQVRVRDRTPQPGPCAFATSNLSVDLQRLRFIGSGDRPIPSVVQNLLADVRPAPGPQPLSNLCGLRDAANERLFRAGYIASVQIPPQEITTGEAVLQVTLTRLMDVQLEGSPGPYKGTIDARIAQLKALDPLNRFEAERILLLAGDVPGLDVALVLRPADTQPGEVIGTLSIRYTPWSVMGNVQNHGSRFLGRELGTARAEFFGLTGLSDRTFISASSTFDVDEQQVLQAGHYMSDSLGRSAGLRFSYAWSRPDVDPLDLRSRSWIAGLDLSAPLIRSVDRNLNIGGGLELIDQRVRLHGEDFSLPVTRDKLRIAFARLGGSLRSPRYDGTDAYNLSGSIELRQGLDILSATNRGEFSGGYAPSRTQGNPTATVIRGGVDGSAGSGPFSLGVSLQGQWANDPLLSIEEYSVGNYTLGRGYDPAVTSGDRALGMRIEPRITLPIRGNVGAQLFAFHDKVRFWNLDDFATEDGRTLSSWGAGARVSLFRRALLEVMYARPSDRGLSTDARRASDRVLISLTTHFSPAVR